MSETQEFEMSQQDLTELLDASKPTPVMYLSGGVPMYASPQENANRAWEKLGKKLGFKHMTVKPLKESRGQRFFTAEPTVEEVRND